MGKVFFASNTRLVVVEYRLNYVYVAHSVVSVAEHAVAKTL